MEEKGPHRLLYQGTDSQSHCCSTIITPEQITCVDNYYHHLTAQLQSTHPHNTDHRSFWHSSKSWFLSFASSLSPFSVCTVCLHQTGYWKALTQGWAFFEEPASSIQRTNKHHLFSLIRRSSDKYFLRSRFIFFLYQNIQLFQDITVCIFAIHKLCSFETLSKICPTGN